GSSGAEAAGRGAIPARPSQLGGRGQRLGDVGARLGANDLTVSSALGDHADVGGGKGRGCQRPALRESSFNVVLQEAGAGQDQRGEAGHNTSHLSFLRPRSTGWIIYGILTR